MSAGTPDLPLAEFPMVCKVRRRWRYLGMWWQSPPTMRNAWRVAANRGRLTNNRLTEALVDAMSADPLASLAALRESFGDKDEVTLRNTYI